MFCCRGYCIELLKALKEKMNFTASLALSPDGQFGSWVNKNGTGICFVIPKYILSTISI